jgi:RimJ/RimL family protein N-acetyltransferase
MQPLHNHHALIRPLFVSEHLQLVIDAVIAGNSPGLLWVDDVDQPRAALLWDKTHSLYLAGISHNPAFNTAISQIVAETVTQVVDVLKIYPGSSDWHPIIETLFSNATLHKPDRVFYRLASLKIPTWRDRLPAGFTISSINEQFMALSRLQNFNAMCEEIESCWNALSDFQQRGFGFCAHNAEAIVCWCTAEYVSGAQCGIGIETLEPYQRQGFATLTASAFAEYCLTHGITAHWDAWAHNMPSVATAEKVGFTKVEDYAIYFATLTPT